MHPIIDEILRARLPIRPDVHRRWSDVLRNEIQPQLDELATLKAARLSGYSPDESSQTPVPPKGGTAVVSSPDAKKGRAA